MNGLSKWSRRRVGACVITVFVLGIAGASVVAWRLADRAGRVSLIDVVAAVMVRGEVFHVRCSSSSDGRTTSTVEQWYSADSGASRTEIAVNGTPLMTGIVSVREGVDLHLSTGSTTPHETTPNASGLALGPPELSIVHIGSLVAVPHVEIVRTSATDGRRIVEATMQRLRPPSEAGEDEPAGDPQTITWELDPTSLLPRSAHFVETLEDGTLLQESDVTCGTAEMLDSSAVDPAIFDIEALKRQAAHP